LRGLATVIGICALRFCFLIITTTLRVKLEFEHVSAFRGFGPKVAVIMLV
jgi:hypothetical protein